MTKRLTFLLLLALPVAAETRLTLLHFSDYHSHAVPFYTERGASQGGIARAIHYLRGEKRKGALVFNGGDMINKGSPAWSDRYTCAEWPWLNNLVDAMALGNHELDYGSEEFHTCVKRLTYPVLSANTTGFRRSMVIEEQGLRIGVFAVAGRDFPQLVKSHAALFGDPVEAARNVVRELREQERVDAVVMIGHQHAEEDYELARAVKGIDVIFGSHSHLLRELTKIDGTNTWFISPGQYLTHISRVELTFDKRRLKRVTGKLIPVDAKLGEDANVAERVASMQRDLETDPRYAELFHVIGTLPAALSVDALAQRTLDVMREAVRADVALSTTSSFRQPLPPGPLTNETLRAALPYDNEIVVCTMSGETLERVLAFGKTRRGTDSDVYVSGADAIDRGRAYVVATTDYLANVAYRDVFNCEKKSSGRRVRAEVAASLAVPPRFTGS